MSLALGSILPWLTAVSAVAAFLVLWRRDRRILAERRAAHAALVSANATLTRIFQAVESTSEAIGIGDFAGNSLYHNRAHRELFGYTVEELNALPASGALFADQATAEQIFASVRAGQPWAGETDVLTKGGERIPAAVRADVIRDELGQPVGIFGVFRDITHERQLAAAAARAGRLDSLGMMASAIAHDFNNIMAVLLGRMSLARLEPDLSETVQRHLTEAERVAWRAQDLTQRLKSFAKGEELKKRPVDLRTLIPDAVGMVNLGAQVRLECQIAPDLHPVLADEAQMLQVLNNLAVNAVQAMPDGGKLTVIAANSGDKVDITVTDTGVGIPEKHRAKIFEPFFTTKPAGTGLGLATCYSIISKHAGELQVRSKIGAGTTFEIVLPAILPGGVYSVT